MRGRPSRATVYARLDSQLTELRNRFGGLPSPEESAYVWADIWHLEAHHSTALEGNTLVLREVETLLDQGKAVGAKPLREYMEVKGYGDAASWVYREALGAGDRTANALITPPGSPAHPLLGHDTGMASFPTSGCNRRRIARQLPTP